MKDIVSTVMWFLAAAILGALLIGGVHLAAAITKGLEVL